MGLSLDEEPQGAGVSLESDAQMYSPRKERLGEAAWLDRICIAALLPSVQG